MQMGRIEWPPKISPGLLLKREEFDHRSVQRLPKKSAVSQQLANFSSLFKRRPGGICGG